MKKRSLFLSLITCAFFFATAQDTTVLISGNKIDKRHWAAIEYLKEKESEVRQAWSDGFGDNKKARKEFFKYYDSISFSIAPCIAPLKITLYDKQLQPGIVLPVESVFMDRRRFVSGQPTAYTDSSVMNLSFPKIWANPPDKKFELVLSAPFQNNLIVELFEGGISTPSTPCNRMAGRSITMLFIFDKTFKVTKVIYQDGIGYYN